MQYVVEDMNADPNTRVLVFIDGQNLYKRCKDLFGHPLCHPNLLASRLAGVRVNNPVGCRFYTGRPDPNDEPIAARNLDRRLSGMRSAGVTVIHRPLRYHWEWAPTEPLGRPGPKSQPVITRMHAWQRPQEKGIDLILGLEVIEFALKGLYDVGIIVSLDRDLHEIPTVLHNLTSLLPHPVRLEAAVPNTKKVPKLLPNFAYTHQITRDIFEMIRDDTAYNADDSEWTPPTVPRSLLRRS